MRFVLSLRIVFRGFLVPLGLLLLIFNAAYSQSESKIAFGILIDNSKSVGSQISFEKDLAKGAVKRFGGGGVFAIGELKRNDQTSFAEFVVGLDWSQNERAIENHIDSIVEVVGQTALYDAIKASTDLVNLKFESGKGTYTGRALLLISDGEDRASAIKSKELIQYVKKTGIEVYIIGLLGRLSNDPGVLSKSARSTSRKFLENLAKETGGRVVFPDDKKTVSDIIDELFLKTK